MPGRGRGGRGGGRGRGRGRGGGRFGGRKRKRAPLDPKEQRLQRKLAKPHGAQAQEATKVFSVDFSKLPKARVGVISWKHDPIKARKKAERGKDKPPKESKEGAQEAMQKLAQAAEAFKGCYPELARQRCASKVMQTLLKYGEVAQRETVCTELKGQWPSLCVDKYGHMVLLKVLYWGSPEQRLAIHGELTGNYRKLAVHSVAAKIVDFVYASAMLSDPDVGFSILHELISDQFRVLKPIGNKTLEEIVNEGGGSTGTKGAATMGDCLRLISKALDKNCFTRPVAALARQFWDAASWKQRDSLTSLLRGSVDKLQISEEGAGLAMRMLGAGSAKNRKHIVKSIKPIAADLSMDPDAVGVVLQALACVDDTKLLNDCITSQLVGNLADLMDDPAGHKALSQLLAVNSKSYLSEAQIKQLQPVSRPDPKNPGSTKPTSKKPSEKRRAEVAAAALPGLLAFCAKNAAELARAQFASLVMLEVFKAAVEATRLDPQGLLAASLGSAGVEAVDANLAQLVTNLTAACFASAGEEEEEKEEPLLTHAYGHLMLKRAVKAAKGRGGLADRIAKGAVQGFTAAATGNRSAFVLASVAESGAAGAKAVLSRALKKNKKAIEAAKPRTKGTDALLKACGRS